METFNSVDILLDYLINETNYADNIFIPSDYEGKIKLLRVLMNVRPAVQIRPDMLRLQDEILESQKNIKTLIDPYILNSVKETFKEFNFPFADKLVLWKGDITTLKADAIVNAANSKLQGCFIPLHKCIDNAIHSAAGIQLRLVCHDLINKQGFDEPTGQAKITKAYNLPSKYVIHTVGPVIYKSVTAEDSSLLASCYNSCLELTKNYSDIKTIAFCCISTGEFRFPKDMAAQIALSSVCHWLISNHGSVNRIIFNVYTQEDYDEYSRLFKQHYKDI